MKRLLFVLATIVAAVVAISTSAAASTSTTVSFIGCWENGGQVTVPAGSTVTLQDGWATPNRGQVQAFLQDVTVTASINGTQIANANGYWSAPEVFTPQPGVTAWVTWWAYPTGITLGAGEGMTFTTDWVLSHPLSAVGFAHGVIPAGRLYGGPISCTVTGT